MLPLNLRIFCKKTANFTKKNCPTLTIASYHFESRRWLLIQFWNCEIFSKNEKVTASQIKVIFSFLGISPFWVLFFPYLYGNELQRFVGLCNSLTSHRSNPYLIKLYGENDYKSNIFKYQYD